MRRKWICDSLLKGCFLEVKDLRTEKLSQITCKKVHTKNYQQRTVFAVAAVHFIRFCYRFGRIAWDVPRFVAWFTLAGHKNCVKSESNLS